jgi:CheY-like chemotaxis protein
MTSLPPLLLEPHRRVHGRGRIVVFTAAADAARRAAETGADGVLAKPFELDDLLRVVAAHAG